MKNNLTPIVVVAFNRPDSLQRILNSLSNANYKNLKIPLFISIDYADNNQKVLDIANKFKWEYGEKKVLPQKVNLGLRNHILQCGALISDFKNIILLEDDLLVSPFFYSYALDALKFSTNKEYIGGISLYNHQLNVQTSTNFSPIEDGYHNWYFQFASSWGQAWTHNQWKDFIKWYENQGVLKSSALIPNNVTSWSEKSWLKYYIAYLIEKNKYFIYPKISFTTNFCEVGTHNKDESTAFQVPLCFGIKNEFYFSTIEESNSIYDSFYENEKLSAYLNVDTKDLCVSLYNYKPIDTSKKYALTTQILNYRILKKYGCSLKPIDANIINNILGNDIFLYDTTVIEKNKFVINKLNKLNYHIKILTHKDSLCLFFLTTIKRIENLFRKINKK